MDYTYLSLFIFFLATSLLIWYPARWMNRSEVTDIEFAWICGIFSGIAISCLVLQFVQ